jgi:hypothetical protein
MKRQPVYWEKIFERHIFNEGLTFEISKKDQQFKIKITSYSVKVSVKNIHRHFPKEDTPVTYRHMKRSSALLITGNTTYPNHKEMSPFSY